VGELTNTTITANTIDIEDGDTYSVMIYGKEIKIRMEAIDAPNKGSPFTNVATEFLKDKISGKTFTVQLRKYDFSILYKHFLPFE
jgi:micrococcal nuclease